MTFLASIQRGPVAHPASHTIGIGSLPEVKRPGFDVNPFTSSSGEVKEGVEIY
jgi:hypothetical protein